VRLVGYLNRNMVTKFSSQTNKNISRKVQFTDSQKLLAHNIKKFLFYFRYKNLQHQ